MALISLIILRSYQRQYEKLKREGDINLPVWTEEYLVTLKRTPFFLHRKVSNLLFHFGKGFLTISTLYFNPSSLSRAMSRKIQLERKSQAYITPRP